MNVLRWTIEGVGIIFVDALLWVALHRALSTGLNRQINKGKQEKE